MGKNKNRRIVLLFPVQSTLHDIQGTDSDGLNLPSMGKEESLSFINSIRQVGRKCMPTMASKNREYEQLKDQNKEKRMQRAFE